MKKLIRFNRIDTPELLVDESIFALQNGLIGVRGNFSEGYNESDYKQTLINGFYNFYDYKYEENSPAFPQVGQRIVNVIDGQSIEIYLENKAINLENCKLTKLEREYDLSKGYTTRKAEYLTKQGYLIHIYEEKLVSFIQKELLIIKLKISSPNYKGKLKIVSSLQLPNKALAKEFDSRINIPSSDQLTIQEKYFNKDLVVLLTETTSSKLVLSAGMIHNIPMDYSTSSKGINGTLEISLENDFEINKFVVYTPQSLYPRYLEDNLRILDEAINKGFEHYKLEQLNYLNDFWKHQNIEIIGNKMLHESIIYNIYQLNSCAVDNTELSIPAKGLTGEGYEGHYFWDTEIYMIPFFAITKPETAKTLLLNRYHHFDKARKVAKDQGATKGVKIPWRTINGSELSPYYPAGSAQYHINSDVAYSVIKYFQFTKDFDFMIDYGFEMLLETARFLYDVGNYHAGKFHINNVTGPDEYTAIVNDNYYTNSMAKYHFEVLGDFYYKYKKKLNLAITLLMVDDQEIEELIKAARLMELPFSKELNVILQDDSFIQKKALDFNKLPIDTFPLILHYHPLFIYKHQVLKQADALLSMFLLDYDDLEVFNQSFDYYLPKTTHDSSLSKCIHAIVAFRLGKVDLGYEYLEDIAKIDMENTHHNTNHGIHIANSGGIYLTILYGILGFRIKDENIVFRPVLPKEIESLKFKLFYKNTEINIYLNSEIEFRVDKPIELGIYSKNILIEDTYSCDYRKNYKTKLKK
ncbi:MAG: glycoside hydrolase family 65 protein [Tenericutes bacterium]|nr:glycoside hydrolase family 65 protein [Mycoplasmatota bacterium]